MSALIGSVSVLADQFAKDVRFGLRSFRQTPALSCLALLSLALGIGATTAIFSAVYSVVFDPFPYGDAHNLLSIGVARPDGQVQLGFSTNQFLNIERNAVTFSDVAGSVWSPVALTGQGEPERLDGVLASTNLFRVLDVKPLLGRAFADRDAQGGAPSVAVLSYKCWWRLFGGDPAIVGKEVRINDQVHTIVGVMPERVYWLEADIYLPVAFQPDRVVERAFSVLVVGRLKPGVSAAQAQNNLHSIFSDMARRNPGQFPVHWSAKAAPFGEVFPARIQRELWMLLSAVGLLLLIACANVASLLLSKASVRQKEMAIRASLGAARGRIIRQLLTESLLLAIVGGALGLLFAYQGLKFILTIVPPDTIPIEAKIALNGPVLLFSLTIALAAAILTGLAPAFHASREHLALTLRENGRGTVGSRTQAAVRQGLVVAEVALSLVLLVAATLMLRTVFALQHVPLGIKVDKILTMNVPLPSTRYPDAAHRTQVLTKFLAAIRQTPGVVGASLNTQLHPFENGHGNVDLAGNTTRDTHDVIIHQTDAQYFPVLGIPLVAGRVWTEAEVSAGRRLVIVNQSFVRSYLQDRSPLGRTLRLPGLTALFSDRPLEIVGVTADVLNQGIVKTAMPEMYLPFTLTGMSQSLAVRTVGEPMAFARAIRASIGQVDATQPVTSVMSLESGLSLRVMSLSRFQMILFGAFAAIGLALAIAGIYGVVSNSVQRRTPELGVRLALGAESYQVVGLVLRSGLRLVLIGISVGLVAALLATQFMASFLFGIPAADPWSFAAVALILCTVGLAACLWPACRAARIDPIISLRQE